MAEGRLHSRLWRVFLIHVLVISVTTICGIAAAAIVVEKLLINRALVSEAEYFWLNRQSDPAFALPNTRNLQSFFDNGGNTQGVSAGAPYAEVPASFRDLGEGQHRVRYGQFNPIVYVSRHAGQTLYLIFQERQVKELAVLFGVLPLILVLLVLYAFAYYSFLQSKKAVSPIVALANRIESFDFVRSDSSDLALSDLRTDTDTEVDLLVQAFQHLSERMRALVERERNFTRYASHELRTPLAVIKGSVSSLELATLDRLPKRALDRIRRTTQDMESLLDTLLLLAREESVSTRDEKVVINDLAMLLVEQSDSYNPDSKVHIIVESTAVLTVNAPERLVMITLDNILRNACLYTREGEVVISIVPGSVTISDNGPGIDAVNLQRIFEPFFRDDEFNGNGFGLGLAIVSRICDEYGWQVDVESEVGVGTSFTVIFTGSVESVLSNLPLSA